MDLPSLIEILGAGLQALLTPALTLSALAVGVAGLATARRRIVLDHGLSMILLAILFSLALAQRGPSSLDTVSRWIVVGAGFVLLDAGRRRVQSLHPSVLVWSLLLGAVAVLLRTNVYGPVLGVVEGSWQSGSAFASLWVYHLGSGVALAVVYGLGVLVGRRLPEGPAEWVGLLSALALILVAGLDHVGTLQRELLLRWPAVTFG